MKNEFIGKVESTLIEPLGSRVLIKLYKKSERTDGGLYIPESGRKDQMKRAMVVAVGDDLDILINVGDVVIFAEFSGQLIVDDNGEEFLLLSCDDILARLKSKY